MPRHQQMKPLQSHRPAASAGVAAAGFVPPRPSLYFVPLPIIDAARANTFETLIAGMTSPPLPRQALLKQHRGRRRIDVAVGLDRGRGEVDTGHGLIRVDVTLNLR